MMTRVATVAAALLLPAAASAQSYKCAVPSAPMSVRPDLATDSQPQRLLPIGGYTGSEALEYAIAAGWLADDEALHTGPDEQVGPPGHQRPTVDARTLNASVAVRSHV